MAAANQHVHTAFANRDANTADTTLPLRSVVTNSYIQALFIESSTQAKIVAMAILIFYVVALVQNPYYFGTPAEWTIGAFSFGCVCLSIYAIFKLLGCLDAGYIPKPVVEDTDHLKAAVRAVNYEGDRERKRRKLTVPQFGFSDRAGERNIYRPSFETNYYD